MMQMPWENCQAKRETAGGNTQWNNCSLKDLRKADVLVLFLKILLKK
jgi:hypothetical protein